MQIGDHDMEHVVTFYTCVALSFVALLTYPNYYFPASPNLYWIFVSPLLVNHDIQCVGSSGRQSDVKAETAKVKTLTVV